MTLETIKKRIEEDSETKDLKISSSDYLVVNRYLDIRGTVKDGYIPKLSLDPYVEIIYVPTKEKLDEINLSKLKTHLHTFDSEVFLQEASVENFEIFNDEREKVASAVTDFLNNYNNKTFTKGLYIYGAYATGKTYILSAIANELARRKVDTLLVFMPDLVRSIKNGINDKTLEAKINSLKQTDVLMIDDIGGENITPWFRDEILLPILQYRLSADLTTFFSSNLDLKELIDAFAGASNHELDYVKAVRLAQRIKDMTIYLKLNQDRYLKYHKMCYNKINTVKRTTLI